MIIEPINEVLNIVGTELDFSTFKIKAFPGFDFNFLENGRASTSTAERQSFSFQTNTVYIEQFNIKYLDVFTIKDDINIYTFIINTNPIISLTGWSRLFADLKEIVRNPAINIISITNIP